MGDGERLRTGLLRRLVPEPAVGILFLAGAVMILLGIPAPKAIPLMVIAVLLDLDRFAAIEDLAVRLERRSRPLVTWIQSSGRPQVTAGVFIALAVGLPERQTGPSTRAALLRGLKTVRPHPPSRGRSVSPAS